MTREEIKNTPEIVDFMLDKSVVADSRIKLHNRIEELCKLAIKALEQEPVLDKIKAEIERQEKWLLQAGCTAYNVDIAFDAIKSAVGRGDVE